MTPGYEPIVGEGESSAHPTIGEVDRFRGQPVVTTPTGLRVPKFGIGTWQLDDAEAADIVSAALDLGVRYIDTAEMYGNERGVGEGISRSGVPRSEVFVTTKIDNRSHEPDAVVAATEASLSRLGTDHVDLLLIHWPTEWDRIGATLSTLAQVQASGMAHHIGVSNFTVDQLDQIADFAPLEMLQVECHPFFQQSELRTWCDHHGWAFTAYSPLARGEVLDNDVLQAIAASHDVSPATVTLAWHLRQDGLTVIPRTSNIEHLRSNFDALELELTDDELARIDGLDEGRRLVSPDHAPWD